MRSSWDTALVRRGENTNSNLILILFVNNKSWLVGKYKFLVSF